jgi:hypothetical protein
LGTISHRPDNRGNKHLTSFPTDVSIMLFTYAAQLFLGLPAVLVEVLLKLTLGNYRR